MTTARTPLIERVARQLAPGVVAEVAEGDEHQVMVPVNSRPVKSYLRMRVRTHVWPGTDPGHTHGLDGFG